MDRAAWFNLILSFIAIIISIYAVYNSYEQNRLTETINYLTIDPDVATYFYYPDFNSSNSSHKAHLADIGSLNIFALDNNSTSESPLIVVKNNGPISIVSLGIKHRFFSFNKAKNKIESSIQMTDSVNDIGGEYMIFKKILNPKEYVFQTLVNSNHEYDSYNNSYLILIYLFNIDYYRESDMKNYSMDVIYFVDNGRVYKKDDFINNRYYQTIVKDIDSYPSRNGQNFPPVSFLMNPKATPTG